VCTRMYRVTLRPRTPVSEIYALSGERYLEATGSAERERERGGGLFILPAAGRTVHNSRAIVGPSPRGGED